ncbi:mobilome CxxCx(11)CxxC protein [Chitinophaga varians]|uniref:mobilome CxxCx(11)CxxC protein n=1 Tax=Chitinophaga varians TaxID=2202339 RepID=UPI00165EE4EC|nr:mobilome CxxCx(11)CxxC protein [Chitinophaga varians]MBC9913167.1 hypothetical protein [Chitinophaga varians]
MIDPNDFNWRATCYDKAGHAFGTAEIYSKRMQLLEKWINFNTTLGIVVPVLIGVILSTYNDQTTRAIVSVFAVVLGGTQLVISIISLTFGWEARKSYYLESAIANRRFSERYNDLLMNATFEVQKFREIEEEDRRRNDLDDKYPFSDKETRRAHRIGLKRFQLECATCHEVPDSLESSECNTCGNF